MECTFQIAYAHASKFRGILKAKQMKAFESIEDIIKALEEHPEWRIPLLKALGLGELVTLPEKVEAYQQENRARFDRLEQAMARLFEGLEELRQVVQRLEQGYEEHARILQEHSRILQEHSQALQELVAEMRESRARQDTFEQTLQELYASHRALQRVVEDLVKDVAILKGSDRERYYRERASAIFGRYLRKVRLVDMGDLLDEIEQKAELSPEEEEELLNADAIFTAVKKRTREPIYVVMEASWVVDSSDVNRAIRRAEILKRLGHPAVPAVGGVEIETEVVGLAMDNRVVLTVNGKILGDALLA